VAGGHSTSSGKAGDVFFESFNAPHAHGKNQFPHTGDDAAQGDESSERPSHRDGESCFGEEGQHGLGNGWGVCVMIFYSESKVRVSTGAKISVDAVELPCTPSGINTSSARPSS